ncbi:MAG: glycine-rich domain-containing protein [Vicinamibacterales bacterium]
MMAIQQPQPRLPGLWERIETISFDAGPTTYPFWARLASENGWSTSFTARVITEYRRFVYLAVVAGHQVSPPDQVDQVWHLHLLYTESYWKFRTESAHRPDA